MERTKVQARKDSFDARVSRKSNTSNNSQVSSDNLSLICKKVYHLVPDEKLQCYVKEFLNKPVEYEYYIVVKFLAPLKEHKLLKFVSLNKKFNSDLVKAFYCNPKDFDNNFGLLSKGNEVCISSAPGFVKFVLLRVSQSMHFNEEGRN
ncbi:hypothetical protein RYX36_007873 [Vicia faba]